MVPPPKTGPLLAFWGDTKGALHIQERSHSFKNPVHDCEFFCLLSSRSMVRIHQGASKNLSGKAKRMVGDKSHMAEATADMAIAISKSLTPWKVGSSDAVKVW